MLRSLVGSEMCIRDRGKAQSPLNRQGAQRKPRKPSNRLPFCGFRSDQGGLPSKARQIGKGKRRKQKRKASLLKKRWCLFLWWLSQRKAREAREGKSFHLIGQKEAKPAKRPCHSSGKLPRKAHFENRKGRRKRPKARKSLGRFCAKRRRLSRLLEAQKLCRKRKQKGKGKQGKRKGKPGKQKGKA